MSHCSPVPWLCTSATGSRSTDTRRAGTGRMPRPPDNVVLNRQAAAALCREFLGWQCRIRQLAARQEGGRPSRGMRPTVMRASGEALSDGIVTLIIETEPAESTQLFRYLYLRTHDPNERYDNMLETLQGSY